jgi:hypothetical protein
VAKEKPNENKSRRNAIPSGNAEPTRTATRSKGRYDCRTRRLVLKRNFQVFAKTLPTRFNTVLAAHAQATEYNTASKQFKTVSVLRHGCLEVVAAPLSVDVAKLTEP